MATHGCVLCNKCQLTGSEDQCSEGAYWKSQGPGRSSYLYDRKDSKSFSFCSQGKQKQAAAWTLCVLKCAVIQKCHFFGLSPMYEVSFLLQPGVTFHCVWTEAHPEPWPRRLMTPAYQIHKISPSCYSIYERGIPAVPLTAVGKINPATQTQFLDGCSEPQNRFFEIFFSVISVFFQSHAESCRLKVELVFGQCASKVVWYTADTVKM